MVKKSLYFSDHLDENRGRNDIAYALCKHSALKGYTAHLPFEKTGTTAVSRIDSCIDLNTEVACTGLTIFNPVDSGDHTDRNAHTSMEIEGCDESFNVYEEICDGWRLRLPIPSSGVADYMNLVLEVNQLLCYFELNGI